MVVCKLCDIPTCVCVCVFVCVCVCLCACVCVCVCVFTQDGRFFEAEPEETSAGVRAYGIRKVFNAGDSGKKVAVDSLSLNM